MTTVWAGLALMWLASLPLLSHARARVWQDETALWTGAAVWAPLKVRPQAQLGRLAHLDGDVETAARHYGAALALWARERGRPRHERIGCEAVRVNLALLAQQQGQYQAAVEWSGYPCD